MKLSPKQVSLPIGMLRGCACLLICCLPPAIADEPSQRLIFETSAPELLPDPDWAPRLLSEEGYAEFAENMQGSEHMIVMRELPDIAAPVVGYGYNFVFGEKNRGFAVFGTQSDGYTLYADVAGDGSLRNELAWRLDESGDGRYTVAFEIMDSGQAGGRPVEFPILLKFVIFPGGVDDDPDPAGVWHSETVRRGEIRVDGQVVLFELYGHSGKYNHPNHALWFDLDGDGQGGESRESPERFRVLDEYVNIDETSYAFRVDPFGRHLELIAETEAVPNRPPLAEGQPAPGFQTSTVDGRAIGLADCRGSFVLLYFWANWCGPCHAEAPRMAEIDQNWGGRGLQIIGITTDSEKTIEAFTSEYGHSWPQVSEAFEGSVHRAYRVEAYPSKYLIDPDGNLLCGGPGPAAWGDCWAAAEAALQSGAD